MMRLIALLVFSLFSVFAHADDFEDADKAWKQGQPWPAHWGLITYPYPEAWNTVMVAFVNKVYPADEAADTWLKDIPYARKPDATVEICAFKRGLFKLATHCLAALVDPEIIGTLKKDDIVALFYPIHGTKRFSRGPGSDARTTVRVFQRLSSGDDPKCWEGMVIMHAPTAQVCRDRINRDQVNRLLTRDFGPREGVKPDASANVPAMAKTSTNPSHELNILTKETKAEIDSDASIPDGS
jgi:hypothetical protein